MSLVSDILILLLPSLLTYVFTRLGLDKLKLQKYERLLRLAEEAVLFAEDAFPDSPGVEKLRKAVEYLKMVAAKAGLRLSDKEAEEKARVAFQRIQKESLEKVLKRVWFFGDIIKSQKESRNCGTQVPQGIPTRCEGTRRVVSPSR